ncbi:MAG: Uncharacterised protein [Flavobacterium sp. SCGC AAA160-P02]|nr:MAG: Uncharacterised protein [Flavobacterium sp. SCGC AAA160-P02]
MNKFIIVCIVGVLVSCSEKETVIGEIPFSYGENNAQPNLFSSNDTLILSWISSKDKKQGSLYFSQFIDGKWMPPTNVTSGSDWFVNWADFPAVANNGNLILTSFLKKSAQGTYTYDVFLNLQTLTGEKIKKDFLLHTDGIQAEHGFVSMAPNGEDGFFVTWLDGRNTTKETENDHHKAMTLRFAEITNKGAIVNEWELDNATCDCCQTSITMTVEGPIVVYRDRSKEEIRDIYSIKNKNGVWQDSKPVHYDGWRINGCPVNGPKVVSNSSNLAVAWFTVVNSIPIVNVSFSTTFGDSFLAPIKINDVDAIGRVDIDFLNKNEVIVSYMETDDLGTYLRVKKVSIDGKMSKSLTVANIDGGRNTGVPQLEIVNNEIFVVYTTSSGGKNQLRSVKLNSENI